MKKNLSTIDHDKLTKLLKRIFNKEDIYSNLLTNIDSLKFFKLILLLENKLNLKFDDKDIHEKNFKNIHTLIRLIQKKFK